ncbi:MAG: hypothetical protein AABZ60_20440 [Planctomycetota bacterium]
MKFRLEEIPLAPREIPEWYQRLELKPRRAYSFLFFFCFLACLGFFGYFTARQLSFEQLKQKSTLIKGKVIQVDLPQIRYEIFLETNEEDIHYILQEILTRPPSSIQTGQSIEVYFVSEDPMKSVTKFSVIEYQSYILITFGLCVFFFFLIWRFGREYFRRTEAYQLGEPLKVTLVSWEEKSGKNRIRLKLPEHFGTHEVSCWLPRYLTRIAIGSEVVGLQYNGCIAYYWTPEQELTV